MEINPVVPQLEGVLDDLKSSPRPTTDDFCQYDVGSDSIPSSGIYLNQCKRHAISETSPPLCLQHLRKIYNKLITDAQVQNLTNRGFSLSLAIPKKYGTHNPNSVLVNLSEYKSAVFKKENQQCHARQQGLSAVYGQAETAACVYLAERQ
jgi:hypothetical protein